KRSPEPHGQGSSRPSFSTNSLSAWTTRWPRFTLVSEGYPRRRLLIVSKGVHVVLVHGHSPQVCLATVGGAPNWTRTSTLTGSEPASSTGWDTGAWVWRMLEDSNPRGVGSPRLTRFRNGRLAARPSIRGNFRWHEPEDL